MSSRRKARPRSRGARVRTSRGARGSLQRRRARALLLGSAVFAIVVLATSLPYSALLSQHQRLSSTARQVTALEAQNKVLRQEAQELSDPATVAGIARRDYGLVAPGSQAYEVLPASGSSVGSAQSSGDVPLDGPPVVPGSALSQALLGADVPAVDTGSAGSGASTSAADDHGGRRSPSGPSSDGFWTRVLRTLEFWG